MDERGGLRYAAGTATRWGPGLILRAEPALVIGTGDGSVEVTDVQPSGRRRMSASEWHRGRGAGSGERFA